MLTILVCGIPTWDMLLQVMYIVQRNHCAGRILYWCNNDIIESASPDGSNRKQLLQTKTAADELFFATILGDNLYFTDRRYALGHRSSTIILNN